jgi:hypothetical protein
VSKKRVCGKRMLGGGLFSSVGSGALPPKFPPKIRKYFSGIVAPAEK